MTRARALSVLTGLAIAACSFAADKTLDVVWGTGQHVKAVVSYPKGQGKAPIIFIASGRSGGMGTNIIKGLADKAVRDGLIAVRFDYGYFASKGEPSKGLVDEADQFDAVIQEVFKDPRVDQKRVVIAGKSLGSVVAHRVFNQKPSYLGEWLLTPIITTLDDAGRLYPNLVVSGRPAVLVIGNQDTENAPLGVVYNFMRDASRKIMVDIVAGNHGFEVTPLTDAMGKRLNAGNADAALEVAEYWVRQIARIIPPAPPAVQVLQKGKKK